MGDAHTTIAELREMVRTFAAERRWEPFHSPKNIAMALAVEAAELMEPMMWIEADASRAIAHDPERRHHLGEEIADVFNLLLNLCNSLNIDLSDAFRAKIVKNAVKYPPPAGA
ncbi:MAG: nucleotide pyrophosphohydrolase [Gemmataceae bacterium]|nr:nucleotide pyrophosphohydrolase [Gemmataceae bacterium]